MLLLFDKGLLAVGNVSTFSVNKIHEVLKKGYSLFADDSLCNATLLKIINCGHWMENV